MGTTEIQIDYGLAMAAGIGNEGGLTDAELQAQAPAFARAAAAVAGRVRQGELGFWGLPGDAVALDAVRRVAKVLPADTEHVLLLGIGGSSLGARAVYQALCGPLELVHARSGVPQLHLPDNSDPWLLHALLQQLPPQRTVVLVISKSGGTVETAAQFLVVRHWLEAALGHESAASHIVAVTDPKNGSLRELATAEGWHTLSIPANVGGRFSVLTAAGLLPALLVGADVEAMLQGAAEMASRCENPALTQNPAGVLAVVHLLHHQKGRPIHVLMPYSDRLRAFASWYVQLWAESLGKRMNRQGERVEQGPTPLPAIGATDQHAQMQLFMEGPRDKLITFLQVREPEVDLTIPDSEGANAYLGQASLGQLLEAERVGTTQALAADGRPSLTIGVKRVDAAHLGALLFLYQAATAFSGELYGVDAFDQPGVELGKRLAFGLLGRAGYEETRTELEEKQANQPTQFRV